MSSLRQESFVIGVLFILAIFVSIIGGFLIEYVVEDITYLVHLKLDPSIVQIGVVLEVLNGLAVVLIGLLLYKYIKPVSKKLANGYLVLRSMEAFVCIFAAVLALSFISLSETYALSNAVESLLQHKFLYSIRDNLLTYLVPLFFSLSALILYYVIDKTSILPRYVALWGYIAAILILCLNLLPIPSNIQFLFALPIIANELFIGMYLIVKGLKVHENELL